MILTEKQEAMISYAKMDRQCDDYSLMLTKYIQFVETFKRTYPSQYIDIVKETQRDNERKEHA